MVNPRLQMQMTEARRRERVAEAGKFTEHTEARPRRTALRAFLASISRARVVPPGSGSDGCGRPSGSGVRSASKRVA
jgi:hypothetical protein